jgi:trimeric autotransporter adhesin
MNQSSHVVIRSPWSALAGLISLSVPLAAQCALQVAPGDGAPGTSGPVYASQLWDPDGSGPLPQRLLVAGEFAVAGNANGNGVATYDLITGAWQGLDDGSWASHRVLAIVAAGNGELVAAGFRTGVANTEVRRWNGSNWLPIGGVGVFQGPGGARIHALALLPNGDLVAAGRFATVQGLPCNNIARWNGTSWQPLGSGILGIAGNTLVEALAVRANGDLVVGGSFTTAGGATVSNCARWDGTAWSDFSAGIALPVATLKLLANGDLVAGIGSTQPISGFQDYGVQRWNGSSWQPIGTGVSTRVEAIVERPNGNLVIGGYWGGLAEWNGSTWQPLVAATLSRIIETVTALPNGHLVVGGSFLATSSALPSYLGRWDGAAWQRLGRGFDRNLTKVLSLRSGDVLAGGWFHHAGGQPGSGFARFDGSAWQPIDAHSGAIVSDIAELGTGEIFSIGSGLRRFDGSSWQFVPDLSGAGFQCIEVVRDGRLIASTSSGFVVWSVGDFQPLAGPLLGFATDVELLPNGDLVACGSFDLGSGPGTASLVRWDGSAWSQLADSFARCDVLEPVAGGVLVVGAFPQIGGIAANHIARYDGVGFSPLGAGLQSFANDITTLPDGSVVVAHQLFGTLGSGAVSRWDGSTWTPLQFAEEGVSCLSFGPRGLAVGGFFESFGGAPTPMFALLQTPCPASAIAYGSGCSGTGGVDRLQTESPAWIGASAVSTATGMPTNALVVGVTGLAAQSLLLPLVLPLALPGCSLLATPDLLQLVVPQAGRASLSLTIPKASALVGMMLFQQAVTFELSPFGNLTSVTSSNGLQVTVGSF